MAQELCEDSGKMVVPPAPVDSTCLHLPDEHGIFVTYIRSSDEVSSADTKYISWQDVFAQ